MQIIFNMKISQSTIWCILSWQSDAQKKVSSKNTASWKVICKFVNVYKWCGLPILYCLLLYCIYSHVYINMYKYLFKMHQTWWLGTVLQCHCSWWHFDKQLSPVLLAFQLQRKQGGKDWLKTGSIEQKDSNHYLVIENPLDVKDIEIQPGFKPGSSECQSDTLTNWTTGALALEQRIDGISIVQLR